MRAIVSRRPTVLLVTDMASCSDCADSIPDGARFCPTCGAATALSDAQPRTPTRVTAEPVASTESASSVVLLIAGLLIAAALVLQWITTGDWICTNQYSGSYSGASATLEDGTE
jgi:hypothetical protein